jgi:hypothetical protein
MLHAWRGKHTVAASTGHQAHASASQLGAEVAHMLWQQHGMPRLVTNGQEGQRLVLQKARASILKQHHMQCNRAASGYSAACIIRKTTIWMRCVAWGSPWACGGAGAVWQHGDDHDSRPSGGDGVPRCCNSNQRLTRRKFLRVYWHQRRTGSRHLGSMTDLSRICSAFCWSGVPHIVAIISAQRQQLQLCSCFAR